jgi:hypothetical protein
MTTTTNNHIIKGYNFIAQYNINRYEDEIIFQNYVKENYVEDVDYEMYICPGDDVLNGLDILNAKMLADEKFIELLENCAYEEDEE